MKKHTNAIILPSVIQRRLETAAVNFLQPANSAAVDFERPPGEPALTHPDSISWRVFKNPLSLFIGGVAAVILELAEPRVRAGVWEHTSFRRNPLARLQRTGLAAMVTVYGPRTQAEAMIARVRAVHDRIGGLTSAGHAYRASDPELLNWVHATASYGFLQAYNTYVRTLDDTARDNYYAEGQTSAQLYGAVDAPTCEKELTGIFASMQGKLEASSIVNEFLDIMRHTPLLPLPRAFTALQSVLVTAAIGLVPAWIRDILGLSGQSEPMAWQRRMIRSLGHAADRVVLRTSPAVLACGRMGLPQDYLYR